MIYSPLPRTRPGHEVQLVPIGSLLRIRRINDYRLTGCGGVADALHAAAQLFCGAEFPSPRIPMTDLLHQSQLAPEDNKFHRGNGDDGKHYWLTPPVLLAELAAEFGPFDFDPCPYPLPAGFDGLTCEWGKSNYVNPPFGSIIHEGKKKGPTAWVRKAITEWQKGKRVVLVYPIDKWVLMLLKAIVGEQGHIRNLGDVRWLATEDGSQGKGTGRHIACFILEPK